MRKILIFTLLCLLALPAVAKGRHSAAEQEKMRKELIDFKIKYLIQETDLAADKRAEFETMYRRMEDEKGALYHRMVEQVRAVQKKKQAATDAEYSTAASLMTSMKGKEAEIEKKFYDQFARILTPEQMFKLKVAEGKFNRQLSKMPRHKRHNK